MFEETRNILLTILAMEKHKEDQNYYINELLERYDLELKDQLKEAERKQEKIKENISLLNFVKSEIEKEVEKWKYLKNILKVKL